MLVLFHARTFVKVLLVVAGLTSSHGERREWGKKRAENESSPGIMKAGSMIVVMWAVLEAA